MNLDFLYGRIWFNSFEDVVSWLSSGVPYYLVTVFVLNCIFNIFETILNWSGRK